MFSSPASGGLRVRRGLALLQAFFKFCFLESL